MYPESSAKQRKYFSKKDSVLRTDVVGVVVFDGEKFLLLHRALNWSGWEFPKGRVKSGEALSDAIGRELFEETGLKKFEPLGKIDELVHLDKARKKEHFIRNYLVRVSSNNKISFANQPVKDGEMAVEHDGFKWCFPKESVGLLKHKNMKETMKKAIKMLGLETEK